AASVLPAATQNRRRGAPSASPAAAASWSTAADHDEGRPRSRLSVVVTASENVRRRAGATASAWAAASIVIEPYSSGVLLPVGGRIFADSRPCSSRTRPPCCRASLRSPYSARLAISVP